MRPNAPCDLRAQPSSQTHACARCALRADECPGGVAARHAGARCPQKGYVSLLRRCNACETRTCGSRNQARLP